MAAATASTIAMLGVSAASAGASFIQAARSSRMAREAEKKAAMFMADARDRMSVNYLEAVQVPLEAYESAERASLASQEQALQQLRETDQRAIIGGAPGVVESGAQFSENLRQQMQRDLYARDMAVAKEEGRLRDELAAIDLAEVTGAQQAMADQEKLRAQSIGSAFGALGEGAMAAFKASKLYSPGNKGRAAQKLSETSGIGIEDAMSMLEGFTAPQLRDIARKGMNSEFATGINSGIQKFNPQG